MILKIHTKKKILSAGAILTCLKNALSERSLIQKEHRLYNST